MEPFWNEIAQLIKEETGFNPPDQWKKREIDLFLGQFLRRLKEICQLDPEKAAQCGLNATKGGQLPDPTLSYDSFRRIFITKESQGKPTTQAMFAIYFGYESPNALIQQRGIQLSSSRPQKTIISSKSKHAVKPRQILIAISFIAICIVFLLMLKFCSQGLPIKDKTTPATATLLFIKTNDGIFRLHVEKDSLVKLVSNPAYINGVEFDASRRLLFWSDTRPWYQCIARGQLDEHFAAFEPGTFKPHLSDSIGYPTGIALDIQNKTVYRADYTLLQISCYDYEGKLLESSIVGKLPGKPSSLKLDAQRKILYWTDVENHRIGRIFLTSMRSEPNFITMAGKFPDGLALDPKRNILYWACPSSNQIGWSPLPKPEPHLLALHESPCALELDTLENTLLYSQRNGDRVCKIPLNQDGTLQKIPPASELVSYYAGGASPCAIRVFHWQKKD